VIKRLGELCERFQLCPVVTGLQYRSGKCNRWQLEDCNCVCKGKETIGSYNHRVEQALEYLDKESDDFVIFEKGRHNDECSFVLVLHGVYQGYGFLDVTHAISGVHDLLDLLEPKRHTYHTAQIVLKYAVKNPKSLQKLKGERG
jgi:DNA polymerase-3 subunit epsilon